MDTAPRIRLFILLGLFLACLSAAGYVFYDLAYGVHTPRPSAFSPEDTIRVEHRTRKHAANDRTIAPANPADPAREETVTAFYCADGVLEISQYKKAPPADLRPTLRFIPQRRPAYPFRYYIEPLASLGEITDPCRRALALQAYSFVFSRPLSLLSSLRLSRDQAAQETAARATMNREIAAIRRSINDGTFHTDAMNQVIAALDAYEAVPGDPTQDHAKNQAAAKVLQAVSAFSRLVLDQERGAIEPYIQTMESVLSPDQKTRLIAAAAQYARRQAPTSARSATIRATSGPASRNSH